jgi:DNA helicase II / ATP-dependent DNA helicase PcrA
MTISNLNPEQQRIVNHIHGAILVLAPVGTGKSTVLSARVAKAIEQGILPERILCLTFTNRAAKELQERLAKTQPSVARKLTVKTFHGLCAHLLRIEARQIGLPADFIIYDENDCLELIKTLSGLKDDKPAREILNTISACKTKANSQALSLDLYLTGLFDQLDADISNIAIQYQTLLKERHALDFADLVFYVRSMFQQVPEIRERWSDRFDLVQVDEVQDTHLSEYRIVRHLASGSGNLAMIGDLDQTIYEWRGSEPQKVIRQFRRDFEPTDYPLTLNYRATKSLLESASTFANSFQTRYTQITPAPICSTGEPIVFHRADSEGAEAQWIGTQIQHLANTLPGFTYSETAILARANWRTEAIAGHLNKMGIPCVTIEQYQFFTRQEIKDALACLRLIVNPFDTNALKRMLLRPSRGIGEATIQKIQEEGQNCGFRLTDLVAPQPLTNDDPQGNLLEAYQQGCIVVFDVETTGTSVSNDIVEIAAIKLVEGKATSSFHAYICDASSVGDSQLIHGHTDQFLVEHGKPARTVFTEFIEFANDALLIGHNVGFDIKMLNAHAQRVGVEVPLMDWADTWNLSTRYIEAESYSLEKLAIHLVFSALPTHRALDDVHATIELLEKLIPLIANTEEYRQALVYKYGEAFESLAETIQTWRKLSQQLRPSDLLAHVLSSSGLFAVYANEQNRIENLKRLINIFRERDEVTLHPDTALRNLLEFTALAKNLDQLSEQDNQVVIMTAHQSKGLEFDTVFIAGMSEGEFPSKLSLRQGELEGEKRLFYVALTRAKQRLLISSASSNSWGNCTSPSRFIKTLQAQYMSSSA